jgi:glycosyltransferase involved in cell wall biosynthesis
MTGSRRARVALVNNSRETFTPTVSGAIGTCLWELCRAAASVGEDPAVVTLPSDAEPYDWPSTHFVHPRSGAEGAFGTRLARSTSRLAGWARVDQRAYAKQVVPLLRRLEPSLVVCNNDLELAVRLVHELPDVPIVHWFHNLELITDLPRRRFVRGGGLRSVAVSSYLARALEIVYQLDPLSVGVAMNGVDTSAFQPRDASEDEGIHRDPVFGYVGRICVEKAPETFLRACLLLAERRHDFAVQMVGDTNWGRSSPTPTRRLVEELSATLENRGIEIRRLGHVAREQVPDALRACDVHVVPSRWDEPCGLTILEGLATGVPIVASATGGSPELVGDAGLLFPRDDIVALSHRLSALLDDPPLRRRLGVLARERALSLTWLRTWDAVTGAPSSEAGHDPMPGSRIDAA